MARPGVTYFDVAQAANALQEANEYPTIDRIRQRLGTGSNTTIATHLKQWKAEHMPSVSEVPKTTLPQPLLTQLQAFWDELRLSSSREFDKEKEAYESEMATLNTTLSDQIKASQAANTTIEEQQQSIDEWEKKWASLDHMLQQQKSENSELKARLATQEETVKNKHETIVTLQEQLNNVTRSLEHFHAAAQKQRDEETLKHASEINRSEQAIQQLKQTIEVNNERYQQLNIEHGHGRFRIEQLALESEQSKSQLVSKIEEAATYKTKLAESENLMVKLTRNLQEKKQFQIALQEKLSALALNYRDLEHANQQLEKASLSKDESIANLMEKLDRVQQENAILSRKLDSMQSKKPPS